MVFCIEKGSGVFLTKRVGLKKNYKWLRIKFCAPTSKLVFLQDSRMCQHRQQKHSHDICRFGHGGSDSGYEPSTLPAKEIVAWP